MVRAAYFSWNELPLSSEDARGVMFVVRVKKPILMVSIEFFSLCHVPPDSIGLRLRMEFELAARLIAPGGGFGMVSGWFLGRGYHKGSGIISKTLMRSLVICRCAHRGN